MLPTNQAYHALRRQLGQMFLSPTWPQSPVTRHTHSTDRDPLLQPHGERAEPCFVIAHRLSTIAHADRIVVLEDGRIREIGTHETLMASPGKYREMVLLQTHPQAATVATR